MATSKIIKPTGEKPTDFEMEIATAIYDLECNSDLKQQLRELYISGAKELDFLGTKVIIIYIPFPQSKSFQKIQVRLVRELKKKFNGKHTFVVTQQRILPKPTRKTRNQKQMRPRSYLDKSQQTNVEHKLETFAGVYKKLTGKDLVFQFPAYD